MKSYDFSGSTDENTPFREAISSLKIRGPVIILLIAASAGLLLLVAKRSPSEDAAVTFKPDPGFTLTVDNDNEKAVHADYYLDGTRIRIQSKRGFKIKGKNATGEPYTLRRSIGKESKPLGPYAPGTEFILDYPGNNEFWELRDKGADTPTGPAV